jgi:hypothetical protein
VVNLGGLAEKRLLFNISLKFFLIFISKNASIKRWKQTLEHHDGNALGEGTQCPGFHEGENPEGGAPYFR